MGRRYTTDFEKVFDRGYSLVTVNVIYYIPDHRSLLNEFIWQTLDKKPTYPRVERFLDFWRRDIDAVIKEIILCDSDALKRQEVRTVNEMFRLN